MHIDLHKLHYSFRKKPLLVGGMAMEYYELRKSGGDIDLIATQEDIAELVKRFPHRVKDLWGDLGVCPHEFEIWRTINLADYTYYSENAIEKDDYFIISLEKLLVMKVLAKNKDKYVKDVNLIVNHVLRELEAKYEEQNRINKRLLTNVKNIIYIEQSGPKD
jgi:hypothetical protein